MLPPDDFVLAQVADVGNSGLSARLDEHPTDMRVPEAFVGVVGVQVGVGISVMGTVTARPPLDGTLNSSSSGHGEEVLQWLGCVVGPVSPKAMVTGGDTWNQVERMHRNRLDATYQDR